MPQSLKVQEVKFTLEEKYETECNCGFYLKHARMYIYLNFLQLQTNLKMSEIQLIAEKDN